MDNKPIALVVEDNPGLAEIFGTALESAGYHTLIMNDGQDAIDWLGQSTPHLIALDLHLPSISGDLILGYIRQKAHLNDVKIISISADTRLSDSLRSSLDYVMNKPVSFAELRDVAAAFLP